LNKDIIMKNIRNNIKVLFFAEICGNLVEAILLFLFQVPMEAFFALNLF